MDFAKQFELAVQIAAAELTKYTAQHGAKEVASLIEQSFEAIELAESRCRGEPS